ncbi:hypothetical protein V1227_24930 [Lentzea sp. DG1S-22]|uniref:hypothetical protein n=1 Tax=Lentzea sp. DG1S-22 TaxID=3108822 RepID=UPI002E77A32D|nr:hypothetical protein [Lentzea sp. DG1S-22]WVH78315.1 hypothetical protein V1227_24930 [Lentzea sp. DG1S-22]
MADETEEIDWNELRVGDIQVAPDGRTRSVTSVTEVPGGTNWVSFDGDPLVGDGVKVTIRARA